MSEKERTGQHIEMYVEIPIPEGLSYEPHYDVNFKKGRTERLKETIAKMRQWIVFMEHVIERAESQVSLNTPEGWMNIGTSYQFMTNSVGTTVMRATSHLYPKEPS